jgi:hypothetical protein
MADKLNTTLYCVRQLHYRKLPFMVPKIEQLF